MITNRKNVSELVQHINELIEFSKLDAVEKYKRHLHLSSNDVPKLIALRTAIEKCSNGENINLNEVLDIKPLNHVYPAQNTYLKIAASLCNADVVDYLLEKGAAAPKNIVFYAIQYQNNDLTNVMNVLKHHKIEINPACTLLNDNYLLYRPTEKGHSLLFWAKRKNHEDITSALTNNGAQLSTADVLSLPGAKFKDNVEEVLATIIKPAP